MKPLHWLPIQSKLKFESLVIAYKTLHYGESRYLKKYFVKCTCPINTRRSNPDLQILRNTGALPTIRRIYTSFQQLSHSFAYPAPGLWNDLSQEIRSAETLLSFSKGRCENASVFAQACLPD